MAMNITSYLEEVRALYKSGETTEHSFRPALARLFQQIDPEITVINEPRRLVDVGAPDFVFSRNGISIGWCEAKDIGKDVRRFAANDYSKEQKGRYTKGLPNLIYTNGLDFEFIRDGEAYAYVTIADLIPTMPARTDQFGVLERLLRDFALQTPVSITSAKKLAEMMAGKAAIIKDIMGRALVSDNAEGRSTELTDQYEGFRQALIHDISVADFADIYAETLAYGLFAARLHDTTQDTFSRAEALELLPRSNPFLRNLFVYIAGPNLDDRLVRMIDDLCAIFRATDLHDLLKDFGRFTARNDPFLHFYETFLAEYNPAKRKARGVWYTPEPVVNFIVRAVDDVLKSEFGLADGLADTSKVSIDWDTGQNDAKGKPIIQKKDVHRVQILDPATGTGTFLAEVIKLVAGRVKGIAPGQWSSYVEKDLIPRLHGFELLMASYAMCHMKLDMMLTEMGYKPSANPPRLSVYLTNSLEEGERVEQTLPFARWVSEEAKGANTIKRDQPIMCVIGNPPYSGISHNNGEWITGLIEDYKYVDGVHFGERKHWLQDDYVKFIRFAEHMIEKNGEGVLGFISNHGYLDNPTFRGMRYRLLETFDKIFVFDLHGNANKKEVSPDGSADKNVFDIKQGVAIIIAVKLGGALQPTVQGNPKIAEAAHVMHREIWGSREAKYDALWDGQIYSREWASTDHEAPFYLFGERDGELANQYEAWFSIVDVMPTSVTGMVTARDSLVIDFDRDAQIKKLELFRDEKKNDNQVRAEFFSGKKAGKYLPGDSRGWSLNKARKDLRKEDLNAKLKSINYRPFDTRIVYYSQNMVDWGREKIAHNFFSGINIGLATARSNKNPDVDHFLATQFMTEAKFAESSTQSAVFPLYLYPEEGTLDQTVRLNFDPKLYAKIREAAGLTGPLVAPDGTDAFRKASGDARPDEVKVFDYIYGVLHAPNYRETYREFLKIDFPRVPFPRDPATFARVSEKGEALRRLHLMEDAAIGETPYPFEGEGDSVVDRPRLEQGRVWINADQGFAGVSDTAWQFHIGGYQPAQKWLKDRRGRALSWDDIRHYQKIIKILNETDRIMKEIDLPLD